MAAEFLLGQHALGAASAFLNDAEAALSRLAQFPEIGTRRDFGGQLGEIRMWPLRPHAYLVFYRERDGVVEVLRGLHSFRPCYGTRSLSSSLGS